MLASSSISRPRSSVAIRGLLCALLIVVSGAELYAQSRSYAIHRRGMLNETVYNTGELGRTYDQGDAGVTKGIPSFEWPAGSGTVIDSKEYIGQENSFGGGMHIAASRSDTVARLYAYCGAVSALPVVGVYSFPLGIQRTENYPVLANGDLNPAYNPNEAEEIIVSKWATPLGITVTRTSRAWSSPDYDDFIIFEYELENNGDKDGNAATPNTPDTLTDVLVSFAYGFAPGKIGYERKFNRWNSNDYQNNDLYARFDRRRWLNYAMDRDGKPELNPQYFADWSQTGKNGGGLLSPMAVGFMPLYYDTLHLAHKGETQVVVASADTVRVWDGNGHLKQPFLNRLETSLISEAKLRAYLDITQTRKNLPYTSTTIFGPDWLGRGSFNVRQSVYFGVGRILVFGPYNFKPGEKIRFTIAEVAGYGAARLAETQAGLVDEGGSCGQNCGESASANAFNPVPNWWQPITYGLTPATFGSDYLTRFQLPQYVNSDVVTIREAADRAIQAYTNQPLMDYDSTQYWPEQSPDHGVYAIPAAVPAPSITIDNTDRAENRLSWGPQVESFKAPQLQAPLSYYSVCKSNSPIGPWTRLDSISKADVRYFSNGKYTYLDSDTRVGQSYYYSVVSVDASGKSSGRTNITLHQTQIGGLATLEEVYVVPNPFVVRTTFTDASGIGGGMNNKIGFYNLPKSCTIRILSYSGQLIETLHHDTGLYSTEYFQVTRNNQIMASGVYFYVVETPDGKRSHGKFVIIH